MITETTISQFSGFDPNGVPEFARARRAMQYSASIDDFASIMKAGNNGGYANDWLIADRNTGEVASLELGLKNVNLWRTKDGYFVGSNYPIDPKLTREETDFDINNKSQSANARHIRWDALMAENKGKIDIAMAQKFLADHFDTFDNKAEPDERTLCGHIELSARGSKPWQPEYGPAGAVQAKATTARDGGPDGDHAPLSAIPAESISRPPHLSEPSGVRVAETAPARFRFPSVDHVPGKVGFRVSSATKLKHGSDIVKFIRVSFSFHPAKRGFRRAPVECLNADPHALSVSSAKGVYL